MVRNVFSNWLALIVRGIIALMLTPILIHRLGAFHYGLWILVMSVLDYCGILDLGIRPTLHRFVARLRGSNERRALNETMASALAVSSVIAVLVMALTLASLSVLPAFFGIRGVATGEFRWLLLFLGTSVAVLFPARVLGAFLCGVQRFDLFNAVEISTAVLRAVLIVLALRRGHGVLGVAAVTLGVSAVMLLLNWNLVYRADPELSLDMRVLNWLRIRELGSYSFYMVLNSAGDYLRFYTDSVVIARMLSIALVTPFSVAGRVMECFKALIFGLVGPLVPKLSELHGRGSAAELRELFVRGTRAAALLSAFIGSILILDGKSLLGFWLGSEFRGTYIILLILTAGYVITLAQFPSNIAIYALGRHQFLGWWMLVEGSINLLLSIYWGRELGLIGVALGTTIPMLVTALLVQPWYVLRLLKYPVWQYLRETAARPLTVWVLFLVICRLLSREGDPLSEASLAITLGWQSGLFALLAYTLGIPASERQEVSHRWKDFAKYGVHLAGA